MYFGNFLDRICSKCNTFPCCCLSGPILRSPIWPVRPTESTSATRGTEPTENIGATDATGSIGTSEPAFTEGFSAFISSFNVRRSSNIKNWSVVTPFYSTPAFDSITGIFTVPKTGKYCFEATINFSTAAAISYNLDAGVNPSFAIRRNTSTNLISGLLPILNIDISQLTVRTILGAGTVTLAGVLDLTAGDAIDLFYEADGLDIGLMLGGANSDGILWSCHRIF
ncbi:hypothetical protein [Lysinibacillus sp. fls2-241-R2A-57]|uniref:hypothetical protein n=1 Tax=Lysinibacillus sp. fls2-241-R2A-57 TaxID=3040292 RepID=UPI002553FC72|nr:hypothetical protein [Lysinibacillus sp. fls2-241-R2A-57]